MRPSGARRVYRLLLWLAPRRIRSRHADEMEAMFLDALAGARGTAQATAVWVAALLDLLRARLRDTVRRRPSIPGIPAERRTGISSDFDAGGGIDGWNGADETINVTVELVRRGYSEAQIAKIWSGNLLRVMDEVQQVAKGLQRSTGPSEPNDEDKQDEHPEGEDHPECPR